MHAPAGDEVQNIGLRRFTLPGSIDVLYKLPCPRQKIIGRQSYPVVGKPYSIEERAERRPFLRITETMVSRQDVLESKSLALRDKHALH